MANKYEFRTYRRTQRVHIFETQLGRAPNTSLCGELKLTDTLPGNSEPLGKAKEYAMDHCYSCLECTEILLKVAGGLNAAEPPSPNKVVALFHIFLIPFLKLREIIRNRRGGFGKLTDNR